VGLKARFCPALPVLVYCLIILLSGTQTQGGENVFHNLFIWRTRDHGQRVPCPLNCRQISIS